MNNETKPTNTAHENEDGTFSIRGTKHSRLSYDELQKLIALSGGSWLTFRESGSPHPFSGKLIDFKAAL